MKLFRRSLLVFLCLSIVCIFFSCGDVKDPLANETIEENNWLPLLSEEQYDEFGLGTYEDTPRLYTDCYENYIYYKGDFNYTTRDGETSSIYTIMRYDVRTGMSYPACRDAACTHLDESCVFYNAKGIVYFLIQGDTMYYISATVKPNGNIDTSIPGAINSYNLKTMKYKYITEWEACDEALMQYYDNCLYFAQVELHKNDNNYDKYIWSYNLKTDRKERLFKYGDNNDISPAGSNPFIVDEKGRMIFMNLPTDYYPGGFGETTRISFSYRNLKKGAEDITIVDTFETRFSVVSLITLRYLDGKLIFQVQEDREEDSVTTSLGEIKNGYYPYSIICADLETGEVTTLIERTTSGFLVAGKYIYYTPLAPELVIGEDGKQGFYNSRGKIVQYDIQTGNERILTYDDHFEFGMSLARYYRGRFIGPAFNRAEGIGMNIEIDVLTGQHRQVNAKGLVNSIY